MSRSISHWVRQSHRWISMFFTLTVILNFVMMGVQGADRAPDGVTYAPLLPLFLLIFSGIYLFFLPYTSRVRAQAS